MKSIYIITILILSLTIQVSVNHQGVFADSQSIRLYPTDDGYVAIDKADPENNDGIQTMLLGKVPYLKTWSAMGVTEDEHVIESINFLKFDLSNFSSEDIGDATINLKPYIVKIQGSLKRISLFEVTENDWSEYSLTYKYKPSYNNSVFSSTDITEPDVWYSWNATELTKKYAGSTLSVVLKFQNIKSPAEEIVTFYSKETDQIDNRPFMEITTNTANETIQESEILNLKPTDDAFVVINLADPDDIEGFQTANTGDLDFLKSWYAWQVTEHQEQIITNSYLKFDLNEIDSQKVFNANLKLAPIIFKSASGVPPTLQLAKVFDNDWIESEITFKNKPVHDDKKFIINTIIANPNNQQEGWYNWDITKLVKQNAGSELSIVYSFSQIDDETEEMISFYSKEAEDQNNAPVLEIEYTLDDTATDTTTEGGGCLIATATYGTELAPQVQLLRELRDNTLLQTNSGTLFIESFNNFYYSFSPYIADYERENPVFKEAVKIVITPMISSLSILNYVDMNSEAEVLGYGISLILLNVGMYLAAPAMLLYKARRWHNL